jgi:hypothetical protein
MIEMMVAAADHRIMKLIGVLCWPTDQHNGVVAGHRIKMIVSKCGRLLQMCTEMMAIG